MPSTPDKKVHIFIARGAHSFVKWRLDSEISASAFQPYWDGHFKVWLAAHRMRFTKTMGKNKIEPSTRGLAEFVVPLLAPIP